MKELSLAKARRRKGSGFIDFLAIFASSREPAFRATTAEALPAGRQVSRRRVVRPGNPLTLGGRTLKLTHWEKTQGQCQHHARRRSRFQKNTQPCLTNAVGEKRMGRSPVSVFKGTARMLGVWPKP